MNNSIPLYFLSVSYNGKKYPGNASGVKQGANCQHFAYELLRHFGYDVPNFRSSNLWEDTIYTKRVKAPRIFDILLFGKTSDSCGAHIAICIAKDRFIHLCRETGYPAVWDMMQFQKRARYRVLVGIKRLKNAPHQ